MLAAEEVVVVVNLKLGQLKFLRGEEEETIYVNL